MSQTAKFAAIDFGAESGRVVVGLFDGKRIELEEVHRFPNGPVQIVDSLHWDLLRLFAEAKQGLAEAAKRHGAEIEGIGVDTWGVDFGLIGRDHVLLGNPYHYRDSRTDGMMEEAFERVSKEEIFDRTGIQFIKLNTIFQLVAMVQSKSPLLDVAERLLLMPDLFNYLLTGRQVSEFSIATTAQLYDPRQACWSKELCAKLGIPHHIFADVIQPGDEVGDLLPAIAEEVGLPTAKVIAPGCHDTASAVAAVPATGSEHAYISSGTWSLMGAEITDPIINEQALAGNFTNEGGVCGTYRFLKNIMGLWLVQECRRQWAKEGEALSYDRITKLASEAEPFRSIVEPDYEEFMGIGDMPAMLTSFCEKTGQPAPETKGQFVRCALESLALKYRWTLEKVDELRGIKHDPIHVVGGGCQNALLNQFTANATQRPVIAGPVEATATGNVLLQAINRGHLASIQEAREVVRNSFDVETFEPQDAAQWDEAYDRYLRTAEQAATM